MQQIELSPELLSLAHWAMGALGVLGSIIVGAVGVLFRKAYKLGETVKTIEVVASEIEDAKGEIRETREEIRNVSKALHVIPAQQMRIEHLENAMAHTTSELRSLVREVGRLGGREEMRSSPSWNGNGEGE